MDGTKEDQGVENICCPYLQIVPCGDTEEHKHLLCELMKTPIPNGRINTWCVSVYKFRECFENKHNKHCSLREKLWRRNYIATPCILCHGNDDLAREIYEVSNENTSS